MYRLPRMRKLLILALTPALLWLVPARAATQPDFSIAKAVPADAFVCVVARHNPERAFIDAYWQDVFDAVKEAGVESDVMELVGMVLGESQTSEANRLKERAQELLAKVDWSALSSGEFVFAERFDSVVSVKGSNISMGPPDIMMIFRGKAGTGSANYDGLMAMIEGGIAEIAKTAGGEALSFQRSEMKGARVASMHFVDLGTGKPPYGLDIAQRNDDIIITISQGMLGEVLDLLSGDGSKSLAATPRFVGAFKQLPPAEDSMVFFDMQRMLVPMRKLLSEITSQQTGVEDIVLNASRTGVAAELSDQSIAAYRQNDYARALELVQQAHEKSPTDSRILYNLACFQALNDQDDKALKTLHQAVDAGFYCPVQISRDGDLADLRDEDAYDAAVKKATEKALAHGGNESEMWQRLANRLLDVPGMLDYTAAVEYTEGHSVHTESVAVLVEGAADMPFYPVIGKSAKLTDFDRYLPEETLSFSVCGGFDIQALYTFVEDSFKTAGAVGESAWHNWEQMQQQFGCDVRTDMIGWIGTEMVSIQLESGAGNVLMLKVTDEDLARTKIKTAFDFLENRLPDLMANNPALAMMAVRTKPLQNEALEGFQQVFFGMNPPFVWGVTDGHLIFADKADAVALCLQTAKGEHPGIRQNERAMAEAVMPKGPFSSVSLTDQRQLGQQLAAGIGMVSMVSGMMSMAIPEEQPRRIISKVAGMLMKLTPAVTKIDFYKSIASQSSFDGRTWRTHMVTHYKSPEERTASAQ
jgi:hypothetical protein